MNEIQQDARSFQSFLWSKGPNWLPVPKWIRVKFGGQYIADSQRVMLMRGLPAVYYFPLEDVHMDFLESSEHVSISDKYGEATHWHVKVGKRKTDNAAWSYGNPTEEAPKHISKYIAFDWKSMEAWYEEDELVRVHPRDPYVRIDTIHSSRHIKAILEGEVIAESNRPVLLFETGLPTRYYFYHTDVRMDLLIPNDHKTECPYKGNASYFSAKIGDKEAKNIAWTYPFPSTEVLKIKDMICLYAERLDELIIDGEIQPAPQLIGDF